MIAYIKKLKEKEEGKRKQIFLFVMIGSMSVVAMIWFYSLGVRFGNPEIKDQANEDIKPFKLFSNSISSTFKNISSSVGKASIPKDVKVKEDEQTEKSSVDLTPIENNN